jgi:hypothetical protein
MTIAVTVVRGSQISAPAVFRLDPGETGTRNPHLRVASYVRNKPKKADTASDNLSAYRQKRNCI